MSPRQAAQMFSGARGKTKPDAPWSTTEDDWMGPFGILALGLIGGPLRPLDKRGPGQIIPESPMSPPSSPLCVGPGLRIPQLLFVRCESQPEG